MRDNIKILYRDGDIVIIEKQPGMSSEVDGSGEDAPTVAGRQCGCVCRSAHRLDKCTGGVLVLAASVRSAGPLSALFSQHAVEKHYIAAVSGTPEPSEGEMCDLLFHDRRCNKSFVVRRARNGAKEAHLSYSLLDTTAVNGAQISLVSVQLYTGRTHQIRVQFASRKLPLLGDKKYGSRDGGCKTALWCSDISFVHPFTGKAVAAHSDPPAVFPWICFESCFERSDAQRAEECGLQSTKKYNTEEKQHDGMK